jgi:D-alanyl-lipoteichoic acid acyltransferase DltB (MBOAT superfamily)
MLEHLIVGKIIEFVQKTKYKIEYSSLLYMQKEKPDLYCQQCSITINVDALGILPLFINYVMRKITLWHGVNHNRWK